MKKKYLLFILIIFSTIAYSQTFFVKVLDQNTKQPIVNAHLKLGDKVYLTDKKGLVIITPINYYRLEISHLQYEKKNIKLRGDRRKQVYLTIKHSQLEEVVISSNKELKTYINFKELTDLPKPIHSFGSVLQDDKLYTFGGDGSIIEYSNKRGLSELINSDESNILKFLQKTKIGNFYRYRNQSFVYDFKKSKWQINSEKFKKRAYHKAIAYKNNIYIIGGKRLTLIKKKEMLIPQIEILDLTNNTVQVDEMNPHQAVNFESMMYNEMLLVIGGSLKQKNNGKKVYTDIVHMYDTNTGYWYELSRMSKAKETRGIIVNDKLYLFGGFKDRKLKEIESFDLISGRWKREGELFTAMEKPAITKHKNIVYLFENNRIVSYNTLNKEIKEYKIDLSLFSSAMFFKDEKLYIIGGAEIGEFRYTPKKSFVEISLEEFTLTKSKKRKNL
jgi:hypothetical protein